MSIVESATTAQSPHDQSPHDPSAGNQSPSHQSLGNAPPASSTAGATNAPASRTLTASKRVSVVDRRVLRIPLVAVSMLTLIAALWAGVHRFGWAIPAISPTLPMAHGPLMVAGFLGTLISLERAVALRKLWSYLAPLTAGVGSISLMAGLGLVGAVLLTAGSLILVAVFVSLLRQQQDVFMQVMAAGAVALAIGNIVWLFGADISSIVHWWLGFLVLTIAGERLELSRMIMHAPRVQRMFVGIAILFAAGLILSSLYPGPGVRLTGSALVLMGIWLARYDVARHTIKMTGLTRYVAACLLAGYAWMITGGALMIFFGGQIAGPYYDAYLHAVFVGFVFSMIFGHAPIIFPSVLSLPLFYRPYFYLPLVVLHAALLVRTAGNILLQPGLRMWGGLGTALAIVLFLGCVLTAVISTLMRERHSA